jgi:hypothetical protein
MIRKTYFAIAVATLALCLLVTPASATHVQCGDTITVSTKLDSDLDCTGEPFGLMIGASDIKLGLNGHTIDGGGEDVGVVDTVGIFSPESTPFQRVRVVNGTVRGFGSAVALHLSDSTINKLSVPLSGAGTTFGGGAGFGAGIHLRGDRNILTQNNLDKMWGRSIVVQGHDAYVAGNRTNGGNFGIEIQGDRNRIILNQINCGDTCAGIQGIAASYATTVVINRNTVTGPFNAYNTGIQASGNGAGSGPGARIALNTIQASASFGITVQDPDAIVGRNVANGNGSYGIWILNAGTTVRNNRTDNNGEYGIVAEEGTVDGGGNLASGNGPNDDHERPECVNVECSAL